MKRINTLLCGMLLSAAGSWGERVHLYDFEKGGKDAVGSLHSDRLMNVEFKDDPVRGSQVARFSGQDSYIDFPACKFGGQFSLSVWICPEPQSSVNGRAPIEVILSSGGVGSKPGVKLYMNNHYAAGRDGFLNLDLRDDNRKGLAAKANAALGYDQWTHIVVTVDSDARTAAFFKDGELVGTDEIMPGFKDNAPFKLGSFFGKTNRWSFKGAMDDLAIYNHVLSAEEVAGLYNGSK